MSNKYLESGTIFRAGPQTNSLGDDITHVVRKAMADHRRLLQGPYGAMAGRRTITLQDGTTITTSANPYGIIPTLTALVIVPSGTVKEVVVEFLFESGLLLGNTAYLSSIDDAYFAGGGSLYNPESVHEDLQGTFEFPEKEMEPDWSSVEPDNGVVSGSYITQGYATGIQEINCATGADGLYNPSMFTGLMISAVQGKYGRGEASLGNVVSDLFFWGLCDSYLSDGLLRTDDYTYFRVRTTNTTCKACRMKTEDIVEDLRQRLIDGRFSADDAKRAEAVLMSTLSPVLLENGDRDEVTLLSGSEITPAETPAIGEPLAYGWHYGYPGNDTCTIIRHGTTIFEAGTCPDHPLYAGVQYTSYKTTISFTFTRNIETELYDISASADTETIGTPWWNFLDATVIWRPDYTHNNIQSFWFRQCETEFVSAPIYCWTDEDGYHDLWINIETFADDEIHIPPIADRHSCAIVYAQPTLSLTGLGGGYAVSFTVGVGIVAGGLKTPTFDADTGSWDINISPINDSWEEYVSNVSVFPGAPDTYVLDAKNFVGVCPAQSFSGSTLPINGQIISVSPNWENYHASYSKNTESGNYVPPFSTAAIIPLLNASAVAVLTRKSKVQNVRVDYYDDRMGTPTEPVFFGRAKLTLLGVDYEFNGGFQVGVTGLIGSGIGWIISSGYLVSNYYLLNSSITNSTAETNREYSAGLIVSGNAVDLQPEQDDRWNGYFNALWNYGFDGIHFSTPASFAGNAKYPTKGIPPSEPKLLGNYSDETEIIDSISFESSPVYWIGWS